MVFFRGLVWHPLEDVMGALNQTMSGARPGRAMIIMVMSLVVSWFIYVPIHELLHVLGCVATGGSVSELQVDRMYGGAILAKFFPFVKVGGDYAGRLTGFETHGSDLIYLATDFMPFVLTIVLGVPLIRVCARRRHPILFGTAVVVGLAPIYQLTGDYFEMASILVTRALTIAVGGESVVIQSLRSDDVFRLYEEVFKCPADLELESASDVAAAIVFIYVSLPVAAFLALLTYACGRAFDLHCFPNRNAVPKSIA